MIDFGKVKILLCLLLALSVHQVKAQEASEGTNFMCVEHEDDDVTVVSEETASMAHSNQLKRLRVNFHYFLRSDGTGNFGPDGDGQGNPFSGYDHAREAVNRVNTWTRNDPPMLPPNNTLGVTDPKILLSLEAVYFHEDDYFHDTVSFAKGGDAYAQFKQNPDSVIQIFVFPSGSFAYASSLSQSATSINYVVMHCNYPRYVNDHLGDGEPFDWGFHPFYKYTGHEVWHLLGLSHTVSYNDGTPYPESDPNDPDDCSDTPSPWEMYNLYNAQSHPHCSWNQNGWASCSDNWMDYTAGVALTPCQVDRMHYGLENGLSRYRTCEALTVNRNLCDIGYPNLKEVGKGVKIGMCTGGNAYLAIDEEVEIYYSDFVEFGVFEADKKSKFEVAYLSACP